MIEELEIRCKEDPDNCFLEVEDNCNEETFYLSLEDVRTDDRVFFALSKEDAKVLAQYLLDNLENLR